MKSPTPGMASDERASYMAVAMLPPVPEGTHLVGNLLDYARAPLSFLTRCSREYGDVVRLRFPGSLVYLLNGSKSRVSVPMGHSANGRS